MATKKYNLAALSLAVLFVACGDDSGNNSNNSEKMEVISSIYNLGDCTESLDGDTVFVKDQKADYICLDGEWSPLEEENDDGKISSSSKGEKSDEKSSSSSKKEDEESSSSSSSEKENLSSSSDSDAEVDSLASSGSQRDSSEAIIDSAKIKDLTISGLAQKGPFVNGSSIVLRELDGKTLVQTGKSFKGTVVNDKGEFSLSSISLKSQYAHLEANGYYLKEKTGKKTTGQIVLNALTDLSNRKNVNINILTHLEYDRVLYLVKTGLDFSDAKKQAESEVFKAFLIDASEFNSSEDLEVFGGTEADVALLTFSILLQGDRNEAELTELLKKISTDLSEDGEWDDSVTKTEIADWALENYYGSSKKFAYRFWSGILGLGLCGSDSVPIGTIKKVANKESSYYNRKVLSQVFSRKASVDQKFICRNDTKWDFADILEIDRYEWTPENSKDGSLLTGPVSGEKMVWDSDSLRYANDLEVSINQGCTSYDVGKFFVVDKSEYAEYGYECTGRSWGGVIIKRDESKFEKMTDSRDGQIYYTIKIGNQIWMAEDLKFDYKVKGTSFEGGPGGGRLYTWAAAMDSAGLYSTNGKGCGNGKRCSTTYPIQGVCPEGWHLPTDQEWYTLYQTTGRNPDALRAKVYFPSATDSYGFSAMTMGDDWWSATEESASEVRGMEKDWHQSVRCLKDNAVENEPENEFDCQCGDLWCGKKKDYVIKIDDNSYGFWTDSTDIVDGGKSTIVYPAEKAALSGRYAFTSIIDECAGVCGQYKMSKGTLDYDPFVMISFTLSEDGVTPKNITSWEGICISFQSDAAVMLSIGLGDIEESINYAIPAVDLGKSQNGTVKNLLWSDFEQPSWAKIKITTEDAVQKAVRINFQMSAKTGSVGNFHIYGVGRYGTCKL